MAKTHCFQLLKCEGFLVFLISYDITLIIFGCGLLIGQNKTFDDITVGLLHLQHSVE